MAESLDHARIHKFLAHLCRAYKKIEESQLAREELKAYLDSIKEAMTQKQLKQPQIQQMLADLELKMMGALEKQGKVVRHEYDNNKINAELIKGIDTLSLQLEAYVKDKELRDKRIKELEEKVERLHA